MPRGSEEEVDGLLEELALSARDAPHGTLVHYPPRGAVAQLLRRACELYLRAESGPRERIRTALSAEPDVASQLIGYVHHAAEQLAATGDAAWLHLGLAAASIENSSLDFRDTLLALAGLYLAAERAGLDPRAAFQTMAGRSSSAIPRGGSSAMSALLTGFPGSAVLASARRRQG